MLGLAGAVDHAFEVGAADLRIVPFTNQRPDLVAEVIELALLLLTCPVEDVDELPREVLGGALHRGVGEQAEHLVPGGADGMLKSASLPGKSCVWFGVLDAQALEAGGEEDGGKTGLHRDSSLDGRRQEIRRREPDQTGGPGSGTERGTTRGEPLIEGWCGQPVPRPRVSGEPERTGNTALDQGLPLPGLPVRAPSKPTDPAGAQASALSCKHASTTLRPAL